MTASAFHGRLKSISGQKWFKIIPPLSPVAILILTWAWGISKAQVENKSDHRELSARISGVEEFVRESKPKLDSLYYWELAKRLERRRGRIND